MLLAIAMISFTGGAVYGWPSMRAILIRDHVLLGSCLPTAQCDEQERDFGLIFTLGAWSNQGGRFFVGYALDWLGPKRTSTVCALAFALGSLIFGLSTSTGGLSCGFFLIGIGGAGVQLSVQSVSALFAKNKSLVMACLSGAFQAASGLYLLFEIVNRASSAFSLRTLLIGHAIVASMIALGCAVVWPHAAYSVQRPMSSTTTTAAAAVNIAINSPASASALDSKPLKERDFSGQARSQPFLLLMTYFAANALQCQFTVGTIGVQMELLGDDDGSMTRIFSLSLALSFLAAPCIGSAFDRFGFAPVFAVINALLLGVPAMLLVPSLPAQVLTCILYSAGRVGLWASFFSFVGATFGFRHYGKLAGGGLLVQSLFCLLQYPLLSITLAMDRDFRFVNALFCVLTAAQFATILGLHRDHLRRLSPVVTRASPSGAVETCSQSVAESAAS